MAFSRLLLALPLVCIPLAGCDMPPASIPTHSWRPGEEQVTCGPGAFQDPESGAWRARDQRALQAKLERGEPAVVSALGCRVEVLTGCSAEADVERVDGEGGAQYFVASDVNARELRGACSGATHVIDHASFSSNGSLRHVSLSALSLDGFDVSGAWQGVMRQPGGPYEIYDVRLDLQQEGDRVTGTSDILTMDGEQWGRLSFEGRLEGTTLYFADVGVVDQEIDLFLAWCMKGGYVVVDPRSRTLRGPWRAFGCLSGSVEATKETPPRGKPPLSSPARVQTVAPVRNGLHPG
jgi:hypothetical protein